MVEFDIGAALAVWFVATAVMSMMMKMAVTAGMSQMPDMPLIFGSMASGDRSTAMKVGAMMHYVVMGAIVFGIAYGARFSVFDEDGWWLGGLIGLAHGAVVGLVFMPMMPSMHPRMARGRVVVGAPMTAPLSGPTPEARSSWPRRVCSARTGAT